jgi:signal peptidase I
VGIGSKWGTPRPSFGLGTKVAILAVGAVFAAGWTAATTSVHPPIVLVTSPVLTGWHVPSASMEPTLHCAKPGDGCLGRYPDRPVVARIPALLPRGDIVVFKTPPLEMVRCGAGGVFIKRVIALPGETWSEKGGYVYINGKKISEGYVSSARRDYRTVSAVKIQPGPFFVMGDYRSASCDSRSWGTVPRANLIGEVTKVYRQE